MAYSHNMKERIYHWFIQTDQKECWNWNGTIGKRGYGVIRQQNKLCYAHRKIYEIENNITLNSNQIIMHKCDNPKCVNIHHLEIGTLQDNVQDMINKNRQCKGEGKKQAKLTETQVLEIYNNNYEPYITIARKYKVSDTLIHLIKQGKRWKYLTQP